MHEHHRKFSQIRKKAREKVFLEFAREFADDPVALKAISKAHQATLAEKNPSSDGITFFYDLPGEADNQARDRLIREYLKR